MDFSDVVLSDMVLSDVVLSDVVLSDLVLSDLVLSDLVLSDLDLIVWPWTSLYGPGPHRMARYTTPWLPVHYSMAPSTLPLWPVRHDPAWPVRHDPAWPVRHLKKSVLRARSSFSSIS